MAKEIKAKDSPITYKKIGDARVRKKRISREIILHILTVVSDEKKIKKSQIRYKVCLNWESFRKHFDFLLKKDFIAECSGTEMGCYELTKKGKELLKSLKEVERLLQ